MARFAPDVDSPPAKQAQNATQSSQVHTHRSQHRQPYEIRKFKVEKIRAQDKSSEGRKSITRCSIEMTLLLAIATALGYYGVKDMSFTPQCETVLPKQLQEQITLNLQSKIFRQDIAIQNITNLLKAHTGLTTMSFVGGCGTGKSYVAAEMIQHFTEQNSHAYNWGEEDQRANHLHHLAVLQNLILDLPSCRPQLVIVDNVSWGQKPYVEDMFRWLKGNSRLREKNLVIIYIFNLDKYGEEHREEAEENTGNDEIRELRNTNVVLFKSFQEKDAMDYLIQWHGRTPGMVLEMIVGNANVRQYGLKRVVNKFQTIE